MKIALLLPALLLMATLQAQVAVEDDLGHTVTLASPAQRVVSLAPHATELLYAVGAGNQLVGAVEHSDWPPEARKLSRVGGYSRLDLEAILALEPDLVVAWDSGNPQGQLQRLRDLGLTVYTSEPRALADIPQALVRLGTLTGHKEQGRAAAADFRTKLAQLAQRYAQRPELRVFYQVWNQPLVTLGQDHLISHIIQLCGGRNIFDDLTVMAPHIDLEAVLLRNPEVIVASGMGEERPEWLEDWQRWPTLSAVAAGNLFFIHPDIIQRHSPRVLEGAARLCEHLDTARRRLRKAKAP